MALGATARLAPSAFFLSWAVSPTIKHMDLLRFLMEAIFEWVRDIIVNVSGRLVEESFAKRANRRRRRKLRRKLPARRNV